MNICRHCKCQFEATSWQLSKRDFECPPCRKARQADYRKRRKDAGDPVVSTKLSKEYHSAYQVEYFKNDENRLRRNKNMRLRGAVEEVAKHRKARRMVRQEIEQGRIVRMPCEVCGAVQSQGHHDDYDKPLDVRWLCRLHHLEFHAKATGAAA